MIRAINFPLESFIDIARNYSPFESTLGGFRIYYGYTDNYDQVGIIAKLDNNYELMTGTNQKFFRREFINQVFGPCPDYCD